MDRREYTPAEQRLIAATQKRLDDELAVQRLYLDIERWERGER